MKVIQIELEPFFNLLKEKEQSMWEIFEQLIKDEPQIIQFLNENKKVEFEYILPNDLTQLKKDQNKFSKAFKNIIYQN